MDRYQELKKENNQSIIYLGEQYQNLAKELIKRVRKFSVKSVDTEIKLKDTIQQIKEYDEKRININSVIPNQDEYIEQEIKKYSKRYVDKDQIKGLIILSILIVITIGWYITYRIITRTPSFNPPSSFNYELYGDQVVLRWEPVELASAYGIYYVSDDNKKSSTYDIYDTNTTTFTLERNRTYTFYIYVKETEYINKSKEISLLVTT